MDTPDVYSKERSLIEGLVGAFVSFVDFEDVHVPDVPMPTTDFTLRVAVAWIAFSRNLGMASTEDDVATLKFFPDYSRIRCVHDAGAELADQADMEALDMVNNWLSQGAQQIEDVSVNVSEARIVLHDGRFLAICAEPCSIGIIGGPSASAYSKSRL